MDSWSGKVGLPVCIEFILSIIFRVNQFDKFFNFFIFFFLVNFFD